MIPAMQVGLFFQQAQTIRNFLAAAARVPENGMRWMQFAGPKPLLASARKFISSL
jgi:hypothetical protein